MPDSGDMPTIEQAGPVCGNCGAPILASAITCTACGVLLAAYQPPAGSASTESAAISTIAAQDDTSATHEVPGPPMLPEPIAPDSGPAGTASPFSTPAFSTPLFESPPAARPRSQSPIGDALRRSREEMTGARTPDAQQASLAAAASLAEMATNDSAFAREIDAELAGARVTFDGAKPVIDTDQVEISQTPAGAPPAVERKPVAAEPAPAAGAEPQPQPQPARRPFPTPPRPERSPTPVTRAESTPPVNRYDDIVETVGTPVSYPDVGQAPRQSPLAPSQVVRWIPFILIGCFVIGFGRSLPGFGGILGFAVVIGVIFLLLRSTAATSRKTTSMPKDKDWNKKRPRF